MVHRFWQKVPGSKYIPYAMQVLASQIVKGCVAVLVLMVISVLLRLLIAGPVAREDSILSALLQQQLSNPDLQIASISEGLSLFIPHCVVFLVVCLAPATFLLAMTATWEHLFRSLYRLSLLYCGIFLVFCIWNAYPELRHGNLTPHSLVTALSVALTQLSHVVVLSHTNVIFESVLTSKGLVVSSSATVPITEHPFFLLAMLIHICAIAYFSLSNLGSTPKRRALWQSLTALTLAILLLGETNLYNVTQGSPVFLPLPTFEAVFDSSVLQFGALHWGLLLITVVSGLILTCLRGNIVFGRSSGSAI
jgi:hypothetical protein